MKKSSFSLVARSVAVTGLAAACVAASVIGGFQLRVDVPAEGSDAVVLVRTYRCHQPEKATVSGTAEGLVDGKRVSVPLRLETIGKGVYSIARQWPDGGAWVLAFSGSYQGHHASTLVALDHRGKVALQETDRGVEPDVRVLARKLSSGDVTKALQRLSAP